MGVVVAEPEQAKRRRDVSSRGDGRRRAERAGRDEVSRLSAIQKRRIILAMAEVVCERGLEETTVSDVVRLARVSRRTFYDVFEDRTDAFLATFEEGIRQAEARVIPAFEAERSWADRVRAGLGALLSFFDEEPELARLCVVHSLSAGSTVLARRTELVKYITRTIDILARATLKGPDPPPMTAEGVIGGVIAIVHARLLERDPAPLIDLTGPLMATIVLPYAGRAAATREHSKPSPKPASNNKHKRADTPGGSPLGDLEMRLTYRTLRVLTAIATTPGASNRQIAEDAGVKDQGQISKLLTRLERLGLTHNTGTGQPKGEPNAWTLTPKGQQIENATHEP
jgi:AcrR family transcriptional regulator/DNA-binding MarR family transcriptional regulator